MKNWLKWSVYTAIFLSVITGVVFIYRLELMFALGGMGEDSSALRPQSAFQSDTRVTWFDDYYTIEYIDDKTVAIGELRYWQGNFNYLIMGEERAVLFDSGLGHRSILPVVRSLTSLPVTVVASHLHFDHIGNHHAFDSIAMIDLLAMRARVDDQQRFSPMDDEFLGAFEGYQLPSLRITEWWSVGQEIHLGNRSLRVLHTPGHTASSMMLLDTERNQLFTGDFIYPGDLLAFLPESNLADYLASTEELIRRSNLDTVLLTAHKESTMQTARTSLSVTAPLLGYKDLRDLKRTLAGIRDNRVQSQMFFPKVYQVNERMALLSDFSWKSGW